MRPRPSGIAKEAPSPPHSRLGGALRQIAEAKYARATPHRSRLPVICIGNFTLGGGGKTPTAIAVASLLANLGARPCFLTRGYGGKSKGVGEFHELDPAGHARRPPTTSAAQPVNATNLTTDPNPTAQVCNDRRPARHGLTPVGFAYPGGATNASVKAVVKELPVRQRPHRRSPVATGPTYAETLPPADWFATARTHRRGDPGEHADTGQRRLRRTAAGGARSSSESVCSRPGSDQLHDAAARRQRPHRAGRPEPPSSTGWPPPARPAVHRRGRAHDRGLRGRPRRHHRADHRDHLQRRGLPVHAVPGVVTVALSPTDVGSGRLEHHYTTDGTDRRSPARPTRPVQRQRSSQSTTVKFAPGTTAGKPEATADTQVIQAPPDTTAPTTTIACNASACSAAAYVATVTVTLRPSTPAGPGWRDLLHDGRLHAHNREPGVLGADPRSTPPAPTQSSTSPDRQRRQRRSGADPAVKVVPVTTEVLLTFDNGTASQYTLGYQQALQPHSANATFFVNSGDDRRVGEHDDVGPSWPPSTRPPTTSAARPNATNLTTDPNPTTQVCTDRSNLVQHGLKPESPSPTPAAPSTPPSKGIVKSCGYGSGAHRRAPSRRPGPTYAESVPPRDWFATRAYAPGGQILRGKPPDPRHGRPPARWRLEPDRHRPVCAQAQIPPPTPLHRLRRLDRARRTSTPSSTGWARPASPAARRPERC